MIHKTHPLLSRALDVLEHLEYVTPKTERLIHEIKNELKNDTIKPIVLPDTRFIDH